MAQTSITIEELRQRLKFWRTAWRPIFGRIMTLTTTRIIAIPEAYKYIKIFGTYNPDSTSYPYALYYDGLVSNMPTSLNVCADENNISYVGTKEGFKIYHITSLNNEISYNNMLQVMIRMESD